MGMAYEYLKCHTVQPKSMSFDQPLVIKVGTAPDMPNIYNLLTKNGRRFDHQSDLDESSGRYSTIFQHGIAFRVYLLCSEI